MAKKRHDTTIPAELRREAEAQLQTVQHDATATRFRDAQQLVHELQVSQIELEMQNEELRLVQVELEKARNRYAELYDFAPCGYLTLDPRTKIEEANLLACTLIGVKRTDLIHQPLRYISSDDADSFHRHCQNVLKSRTEQSCQVRLRDKAGIMHWVHFESLAVHDGPGRPTRWRTALLNITEHRWAEAQLKASYTQLRNLTARMESVREEERILIAREIHDELGQALTGVKLELSLFRDQLPEGRPALTDRLESISTLIDTTIQSVRRIATELRPIVLDQLGLIPAIEWQAHEFQSRTGIQCTLDIYLRSVTLSQAESTAMFRIFQEVLTNVARHAQATTVNITLQEQAGGLVLEVRDNGRGVTDAELSDPTSLGLVGMRERALLLGGEITLTGSPGKGTLVRARIECDQLRVK